MTSLLFIILLLLSYSYFKYSAILKKHLIISEIAQKRRDLIKLIQKEKLSVNSEVFKVIYYNLEYLLRIKYYNLNHMLPSLNELKMQYELSLHDKEAYQRFEKELKSLSKDEEIAHFLKGFSRTFFKAIFQKKFIWQIIGIMARTGIDRLSSRIRKLIQAEKDMKCFHNIVESYAN